MLQTAQINVNHVHLKMATFARIAISRMLLDTEMSNESVRWGGSVAVQHWPHLTQIDNPYSYNSARRRITKSSFAPRNS